MSTSRAEARSRRSMAVAIMTVTASALVTAAAAAPTSGPDEDNWSASAPVDQDVLDMIDRSLAAAPSVAALPSPTATALASARASQAAPSANSGVDRAPANALSARGIPAGALAAYGAASATLARTMPECHLTWPLLAAIGTVESGNGRHGGARIGSDGVVRPAIIGIRLDGSVAGTAVVVDTDRGRYDGDPGYDRAVGPMQFLPGTWVAYALAAAPGRVPDPQNINDAALAAGAYLCASGHDVSNAAGRRAAVLRYNHSNAYADTVLALAAVYENAPMAALDEPDPSPASAPTSSVPPPAVVPAVPSPSVTPTPSVTTPSPARAARRAPVPARARPRRRPRPSARPRARARARHRARPRRRAPAPRRPPVRRRRPPKRCRRPRTWC